jgi:hypothetical protein
MSKNHLEPLLAYIEFCFPEAYPEIKAKDLINPHLFSPFVLELPAGVMKEAEDFVSNLYKIKESDSYQDKLPLPDDFKNWPLNPSVLTCFDFHFSEEMGLKLIEINTNASLYLPIILQRCAQADNCVPPQFDRLYESFVSGLNLKAREAISIFDEKPENEGLYFEFLIFKEWLTKKGYPTNIVSLENFESDSAAKIYNRFTDFYFAEPKSSSVKEHYTNKTKLFSPNPREYFLMADKKRLTPLREELEQTDAKLASIIPETKLFSEFSDKDEVWAQRKKYFFKPSQSFGSKGAFSGKGISRKAFEGIYSPNFIAQELCPAGKRVFDWNGQEHEMKFDLRFFTFNGEIQNYGARLYQGQTTNMKTPLGGLTPISFI